MAIKYKSEQTNIYNHYILCGLLQFSNHIEQGLTQIYCIVEVLSYTRITCALLWNHIAIRIPDSTDSNHTSKNINYNVYFGLKLHQLPSQWPTDKHHNVPLCKDFNIITVHSFFQSDILSSLKERGFGVLWISYNGCCLWHCFYRSKLML